MVSLPNQYAAIVLTCDRYHVFAEHMIRSYERFWPEHPFKFIVPFQEWPSDLATRCGEKASFVQTPEPIKQTVLAMLDGIGDGEWIYWCIDDKYLVDLDARYVKRVAEWVRGIADPLVCGISFARSRRMLRDEYLYTDETIADERGGRFIRRRDYSQIWLHQFLRAKVLRNLFEGFPDGRYSAKAMDEMKERAPLPDNHRLYVSEANHVVFGESTTRGKLTPNCAASLRMYGLQAPEIPSSEKDIIIGSLP